MELQPKAILTPNQFCLSIKQFSFQQRFFKWQQYVRSLKEVSSDFYQPALEKFIEHYPFNHTYWIALIEHILTKPKSKGPAVKMYQIALLKNSRCIALWKSYLMWLKGNILNSDPKYLKNQLEKASRIVGTHYHAEWIFEEYFELEKDPFKKFQVMKRALVSPLKQIDKIFDLVVTFIDSSQELTLQLLEKIAIQEELVQSGNGDKIKNKQTYGIELKQKIKVSLRKLYQPTKKHVEQRYHFEQKLQNEQYRPFEGSYQIWKAYLHFIKNSGNVEFVYPLYQRALISLCDKQSLWQDYFLILDNENNQSRVIYLLRSHATFFSNLSRELSYYWLDIEQRQNPQRARELFVELQKNQHHLEAFLRHIQLQLRAKQFNNAKTIYETILTVFTSNMNIIAYVLIEYAEFTIKYFRDVQFAKKLLHTYFQSSVYNEYLFLSYLEFFVNHVEQKEGTKESKENYDLFLQVTCSGLRRALENTPQRFQLVKAIAMKLLREYVNSIYLIKTAEKKIKEIEIQKRRESKAPSTSKRPYSQMISQ